jgi:glycosyltransferase involved in cell wall biosynthesis
MLSVVLSIYNTKNEYIYLAINSILSQTYKDYEFIIINNGNSSEVNKIIKSFRDKRIKLLSTKIVVTLYESREIGIRASLNNWIALMDADDISHHQRFENQIKFIKNNSQLNIGCVGTWAKYMNSMGNVVGYRKSSPVNIKDYNKMKLSNEAIITTDPSAIINKQAFLRIGGYNPQYSPAADLDLWYRMVEKGYIILSLPQYLFYYRIHSNADSSKNFMLQRKKTHFANLNMERRRGNKKEIEYVEFCNKYWNNVLYRFPRMWRNYAKYYYKQAGMKYLEKKYILVVVFLILSMIINPIFVINRITSHLFGWKNL